MFSESQRSVILRLSELCLGSNTDDTHGLTFQQWIQIKETTDDRYTLNMLKICLSKLNPMPTTLRPLIDSNWHCSNELAAYLLQLLEFNRFFLPEISEWIESAEYVATCSSMSHCLCDTLKLCKTLVENECPMTSELLSKLTELISLDSAKCIVSTYLDLLINISDRLEHVDAIESWVQNYLCAKLFNVQVLSTVSFVHISDTSIFRKYILTSLLTLKTSAKRHGSEERMDDVRLRLATLERSVQESLGDEAADGCPFVKLFIEHDAMLLTSSICLQDIYVAIGLELESHKFLNSLLRAIQFDEDVLIDWLLSDQDTAVLTLELLVKYLKLAGNENQPCLHDETRTVLSKLYQKLLKKIGRNLFPYNVKPLMKLLGRVTLNCEEI